MLTATPYPIRVYHRACRQQPQYYLFYLLSPSSNILASSQINAICWLTASRACTDNLYNIYLIACLSRYGSIFVGFRLIIHPVRKLNTILYRLTITHIYLLRSHENLATSKTSGGRRERAKQLIRARMHIVFHPCTRRAR